MQWLHCKFFFFPPKYIGGEKWTYVCQDGNSIQLEWGEKVAQLVEALLYRVVEGWNPIQLPFALTLPQIKKSPARVTNFMILERVGEI